MPAILETGVVFTEILKILKDLILERYLKEDREENILDGLYIVESRIKIKFLIPILQCLHKEGLDKIIKKFGEESMEVILAAKHQKKQDVINEIADLIYHLIVLWSRKLRWTGI